MIIMIINLIFDLNSVILHPSFSHIILNSKEKRNFSVNMRNFFWGPPEDDLQFLAWNASDSRAVSKQFCGRLLVPPLSLPLSPRCLPYTSFVHIYVVRYCSLHASSSHHVYSISNRCYFLFVLFSVCSSLTFAALYVCDWIICRLNQTSVHHLQYHYCIYTVVAMARFVLMTSD